MKNSVFIQEGPIFVNIRVIIYNKISKDQRWQSWKQRYDENSPQQRHTIKNRE